MTPEKRLKTRIVWMDIANIICILAVISMHLNGAVHSFAPTGSWTFGLVTDCLCYFAVPVFMMLSGANLIGYRKKYDTKTFFKKRFMKVLIPSIFWIAATMILKIFVFKTLAAPQSFSELLNYIFTNKAESTYYFIWAILGVYLTIPVLSVLAEEKYRKVLWYLVGAFFIFNALIPNILTLFNVSYNSSFSLQIGGYAMYAALGYLLNTTKINKKALWTVIAVAVAGIAYRFIHTIISSYAAGVLVNISWGYFQFHAILQASAIFLILKNLNLKKIEQKPKLCNALAKISSCSFGIYLTHFLLIFVLRKILPLPGWAWQTIMIPVVYIINLTIILILKKIPLIKKVVA